MKTKVELLVVSVRDGFQYDNPNGVPEKVLELQPVYDTVFYKLSGGTNLLLRTINVDAVAEMLPGTTVTILLGTKTEMDAEEALNAQNAAIVASLPPTEEQTAEGDSVAKTGVDANADGSQAEVTV